MKPVIGIVICGIENNRQFVTNAYIEAIQQENALAVLIPRASDKTSMIQYITLCDGFLFCGGNDISPLLFGEELLTNKGRTDQETDIFHLDFMKMVLESQKPALAICRGMQVLNLALDGTIYQDISLLGTTHLCHMQSSEKRSDPSHRISVLNNSILSDLLGDSCEVNSYHHQCVRELGQNLRISALASDGVIEAIEHCMLPFVLGVQWHPEAMLDVHLITSPSPMKKIFSSFINHAKKQKNYTY